MSDGDGDDHFIKFCDVMSMYKDKKLTANEVHFKFKELFQADPHLYVEFTTFMNMKQRKREQVELPTNQHGFGLFLD